MPDFPDDWSQSSLAELTAISSGEALPEHLRSGHIPLMGANGQIGNASDFNFSGGYLVGRVGAAGAVTDANFECWASDNTLTVRARSEYIDHLYLGYMLRHLKLEELATHNAQPLVTQTQLRSRSCLVPKLLGEQRLIAQILTTLDTHIRQTVEVITKLEQVKQGLITDLLTYGIDEKGELRPSPNDAPELYKDSRVGRIPLEWSVLPISDVVSLPSGQVSPLAAAYRDMPLIAPDHIEAGTGKLLDVESAAEQGAISGKYVFQPRDVIYSKIRPYLKKAWLADRHGLCSADMYPLRPRPGHSPVFVLNILLGNDFSSFANSVSMRTGIPKINRSELRTYETAVPPAYEQRRIESTIEASDKDLENESVALGKLLKTKVGLMDDLLTGRVRVTRLLDEAEQAVG